jgi:hypothetical protein
MWYSTALYRAAEKESILESEFEQMILSGCHSTDGALTELSVKITSHPQRADLAVLLTTGKS